MPSPAPRSYDTPSGSGTACRAGTTVSCAARAPRPPERGGEPHPDPLADPARVDALADLDDLAGAVLPRHLERPRCGAGPRLPVGRVDAGDAQAHAHLARPRRGQLDLLELQDVGRAGGAVHGSEHGGLQAGAGTAATWIVPCLRGPAGRGVRGGSPGEEVRVPDPREQSAVRLLQAASATSAFDRFVVGPLLLSVAAGFDVPLTAAAAVASWYFLLLRPEPARLGPAQRPARPGAHHAGDAGARGGRRARLGARPEPGAARGRAGADRRVAWRPSSRPG